MYGWNERPARAEVAHSIGGDKPATVYRIGRYEITVPEGGGDVTYRVPSHYGSDPRRVLPNMEIADGEIRIPITDLVGEVLTRLDPRELAGALWQNAEVRDAFMGCLARDWSDDAIGEADRRAFLVKVREAVHDAAVDRLFQKVAGLEHDASQRWRVWQVIRDANEALRVNGATWPSGRPLQLAEPGDEPAFKIGGASWNEAREHWRAELAKLFPGPAPEPAASDEGLL